MKKRIIYITLFLCLTHTTFAQDVQNKPIISQDKLEIQEKLTEKRSVLQPEISQKKQEVRTLIENKKEENVSQIQVLARERILKAVNILFERMEAFIVRYDKMIERIENKIANMESGTTQEAQMFTDVAKANLSESIILITATKIELTNTLQTQTTPETIRSIISLSTESLQKTHKSLILVVQSLKADDLFID